MKNLRISAIQILFVNQQPQKYHFLKLNAEVPKILKSRKIRVVECFMNSYIVPQWLMFFLKKFMLPSAQALTCYHSRFSLFLDVLFHLCVSDILEEFCGQMIAGLGGCSGGTVPPLMGPQNGTETHATAGCFPKPPPLEAPSFFETTSTIQEMTSGCVGVGMGLNTSTKTKKIMYDLLDNDEFDREEIPTYEEVARLFPRPGVFRPIVLIGAPGVGRNELKRRLMALEPDRYKATIPRKH